MTDSAPARLPLRRVAQRTFWFLIVLAIALGAVWSGRGALRAWLLPESLVTGRAASEARLAGLEQRVAEVADLSRQLSERINANSTAQRVIRDDLLGIGERAALLEEAVNKAAQAQRRDDLADLLRLDQVEMLLIQAQWRLQHAHDRAGALAAYTYAEAALVRLSAPQYVSLRQSLAQEHAAVAAAADSRGDAERALDAIEQAIAGLPLAAPVDTGAASGRLARVLNALVQVRRSDPHLLLAAADRERARVTLMLDSALARAALERGDLAGLQAALARLDDGVRSLYPESDARTQLLARTASLAQRPLVSELPLLGSSLEQLRHLRDAMNVAGAQR